MAGRYRTVLARLIVWASVLAGTVTLPGQVRAGEAVTWAVLDFPPFQIRVGDHRGSGSFDGLLDLLVRQIPEVDHDIVMMSFARREEEIRQGRPLCTPGLFRTPAREKLLVFSLPALIHLDNRLVIRAAQASRLKAQGPVDLEALLADQKLIGGIISERSFAPNIDPLLRRYSGAPNLVMRSIKSSQVFEMLMTGEIDYTILFPHEAAYLAGTPERLEAVRVLPIAGTPPYIFTHVACTKGPWGEAMIARIDTILQGSRRNQDYRAFSERWYVESDKALIRQYYPNMLLAHPR